MGIFQQAQAIGHVRLLSGNLQSYAVSAFADAVLVSKTSASSS